MFCALTAVEFIRSISTVLQPVAALRVIVTGPVSARLLSAAWIICSKQVYVYTNRRVATQYTFTGDNTRVRSLTAVVLIRVVHAVPHVVTSVLAGDALALPAGELVWAAGLSTWNDTWVALVAKSVCLHALYAYWSSFWIKRKKLWLNQRSLFLNINSPSVPQALCSSEPSRQSSSPSQTKPSEMHSPLVTHWNSCEVHVGGAVTTGHLH